MALKPPVRFFLFALGTTLVVFLGLNALTQPYEDSISSFPSAIPFYQDYVWYLDDIVGPALFFAAGLTMFWLAVRTSLRTLWPVALLGIFYIAFGLGDTVDAHWVIAQGAGAVDQVKSFSSFGSKIFSVLAIGFATIYSADLVKRPAAKALVFAFLLMMIAQVHIAVSLEFAGFSFHVLEESVEVTAAGFASWAVLSGLLPAPGSGKSENYEIR